ncbi:MAG: maltose alpha-D-glucosyltransferase [Elusimicrobia bacterium]|nr:maltose alpha-D-glucosyltransferase [Elusimicrobiota bacterium]
MTSSKKTFPPDPQWYKDAVIYELNVKSFSDGDDNGIGDFKGLISRLPYLQSLGVTAVWLLPFYPSPQRDDGYDIADYYGVNPEYGDLGDFREFMREARSRGIRVITELVVNHTSDQHPWFQRARAAKPGSWAREFYVWSGTPDKYRDARIIFKDFETSNWTWDAAAGAYYWHRFYHHQPDLNYENPAVQREIFKVVDFWFSLGVDGLRLDAVPYLYEAEGTNCENLPETHAFLKKLRAHIDARFKDKMLLCEANQWPEDAAAYFGAGDECQMAFHFPLMPRLFMSLWMEDSCAITDILEQTPAVPGNCQWAVFLRNHDELTLEMVTDEERDYMYRVYARDAKARINLGIRRRLAPLVGNNRRKVELLNFLLFSLPGTPVIYYGDELGMGDNYYLGDRNGVRTPMQWSPDRNAGFSKANPHKLFLPVIMDPEYHFEALNVENQEGNLSSLLWWMRRVITTRRQFRAFGRGAFEPAQSDNPKVLAFVRRHGEESILVVANLSRFSQSAALDLSRYAGCVPVEVFGGSEFPQVKEQPYQMTLGIHDYFWFQLRRPEAAAQTASEAALPELKLEEASWPGLLDSPERSALEKALPAYLRERRWFGGKARKMRRLKISSVVPTGEAAMPLALIEVLYTQGSPETYLLPLAWKEEAAAAGIIEASPGAAIAWLELSGKRGLLYDAAYDKAFHAAFLSLFFGKRRHCHGPEALVVEQNKKLLKAALVKNGLAQESRVIKAEQSNTSIIYGSVYFGKLFRRLEEGVNPDIEIGRRLTEGAKLPAIPPFMGAVTLHREGRFYGVVGLLQGYAPNQGDSWSYAVEQVSGYYERVLAGLPKMGPAPQPPDPLVTDPKEMPQLMGGLIGGVCLEMMSLLGRRTAEMHLALSSAGTDPDFCPEPFTRLYQRSVYQSMLGLTASTMRLLSRKLKDLPDAVRPVASLVLENKPAVIKSFQGILDRKISAKKIRIHGDFHLGQVLFTGKDFVIIDFEGEPAKPLGERRLKRSALRDAAGMLRSFHYAARAPFYLQKNIAAENMKILEPWAELWYSYVSAAFLHSYFKTAAGADFLPQDPAGTAALLRVFLAEKAVYELFYELNNRPDWISIPLQGLLQVIQPRPGETGKSIRPA